MRCSQQLAAFGSSRDLSVLVGTANNEKQSGAPMQHGRGPDRPHTIQQGLHFYAFIIRCGFSNTGAFFAALTDCIIKLGGIEHTSKYRPRRAIAYDM